MDTSTKKLITLQQFGNSLNLNQDELNEVELRKKLYYLNQSLRELRSNHSLTQQQVADKTGIPRSTISKIESGSLNTTLKTLFKIAATFDKKLEIRFV